MNYGAQLSVDLPPSQAFLQLDTKSKRDNEGVNDCHISKAGTFFDMSRAVRYSLQYVNFFWHIKNVTSRNNKITFKHAGNTYNTTLDIGYYNITNFITEILTKLNAQLAGWTVIDTGDKDGHRIRISFPTPFTVMTSGQDRSPWEMSGFKITGNESQDTYTVHTGYAKLWYTRYIDCCSSALNRYQNIPDESSNYPVSNVLVRIYGDDGTSSNAIREDITSPLTQPHAVQFTSDYPKWVHFAPPKSDQALGGLIDLRLIDEYGKVVEMDDAENYPDYSLIFLTRSLE